MKNYKNLVSLAVLGLIAWSGCSKDSGSSAAPGASQGSEATPPESSRTSGKMAALTDGQILKIVSNVDSGEIEQAQVALSKATTLAVREFAQQMVDQHTQSLQAAQQLASQTKIIPSPSTPADEVHTKGLKVLDELKSAEATSFDETYMKTQLKEHQEVLKLLDDKLIPSASSPELRSALEETKSMVQHHIAMATQIQL
jgi:putative membrane protein